MSYFRICSSCGGNLDPGEKCDCEYETEKKNKTLAEMLKVEKQGQITFSFVTDAEKRAAV